MTPYLQGLTYPIAQWPGPNKICYKMWYLYHIDGLVQERCNSIAKALELHLSCTNPSTWHHCYISQMSGCQGVGVWPHVTWLIHSIGMANILVIMVIIINWIISWDRNNDACYQLLNHQKTLHTGTILSPRRWFSALEHIYEKTMLLARYIVTENQYGINT